MNLDNSDTRLDNSDLWDAEALGEARRRDRADSDWYAREARLLFIDAARWQRDQLRTDEAVERVAEAIYRSHDSYTHFTAKPWAEMVKSKDRANKYRVKQDREAARAAITALLGEEP